MPNLALYAGVGAAALLIATQNKEAENCGIVGIVSDSGDASEFLLEGLTILQVTKNKHTENPQQS